MCEAIELGLEFILDLDLDVLEGEFKKFGDGVEMPLLSVMEIDGIGEDEFLELCVIHDSLVLSQEILQFSWVV